MNVLFVCTGNICRSPLAEAVFRHRVAERGLEHRLFADSAGVSDEEAGNPIDPRAVAAAERRGYALPDRLARQIVPSDFRDHDLILGMTAVHLSRLEAERPGDATALLGVLLDHAPEAGTRDVPDPWWGGPADFEHALDLIEAGVDGLVAQLAGRLGEAG